MNLKEKLYRLVEPPEEDENPDLYDIIMMIAIIVSIIPLMFKRSHSVFLATDKITVTLFIFDYCIRWLTADLSGMFSNPAVFMEQFLLFRITIKAA